MNIEDFKATISDEKPPSEINELLKAMWYDANGDWEEAHNIAQDINDSNGSWIHAYLHRKEGDISNASYWYARAGKTRPNTSLDEEWEFIVKNFLSR